MTSPRLIVCIPTFMKEEFIEEIIREEADLYQKLDINLYIADSSPDDNTEMIFKKYEKKYSILHYKRFPVDMPSNEKVYKIYQMSENEIKCDYIWIRSDALRYSKFIIYTLVEKFLRMQFDIIVINYMGYGDRGVRVIRDRQFLFEEYAWAMTLYGAVILNVRTVLSKTNWNDVESRYLQPHCINFSHVCLFFEKIEYLKKFSALVMDVTFEMVWGVPKKSSWYNMWFEMLFDVWPSAISEISSTYQNKLKVIKSHFDKLFLFNYKLLKNLIDDHVLTFDIYKKYEDEFSEYLNIPLETFCKMLLGCELSELEKFSIMPEYIFLKEFLNKYSKFIIYGAGEKAEKYAEFLRLNNMEFEAFLVSDDNHISSEKKMGHPVYIASEYIFPSDAGIIMGLNLKNQKEVLPILKEHGVLQRTFAFPYSPISLVQLDQALQRGEIESSE